MLKTIALFTTHLVSKMLKDDLYLPVGLDGIGQLKVLLSENDDHTYLVVEDPRNKEVIKVTNMSGDLVIERAVDGTKASTFPCGSSVRFEMLPIIVKEMICQEDCADDCDCEPIAYSGHLLPKATVNVEWEGNIIFAGGGVMRLGIRDAPDWMEVSQANNALILRGTPTTAGEISVTAAGTNCAGRQFDAITLGIVIAEGN